MRNKDLIAPIRTRGAIPVRSAEVGENVISTPVRTRGAIRTRGVAAVPHPALRLQRSLELVDLVQELREQVGDFPLTAFIHGWGSQPAEAFFTVLSPLLRKGDALWFIPTPETQIPTASSEAEGAVTLSLSRDADRRTYRNLVGDIVFFPPLDATEAEQVAEWGQRARAIIINGQGPQCDALLQAGCDAMLMTYRWTGEKTLEEYIFS